MTIHFRRAGLRASATIMALAASIGLAQAQAPTAEAVLTTYADIAQAGYEDSLTTAKALDGAIDAFLAAPSEDTLQAAKEAWLAARAPYQQTEAFRFGNAIVDDWEGRVNAWPLDEGLIDYVDAGYGTESDENDLYVANVVANKTIEISGEDVDASTITPEFLSGTLQEAGDIEANVATGYHAIEFLLWGQDLNGTGPGAGARPYTDYDQANCTHGNCDRRGEYLKAASSASGVGSRRDGRQLGQGRRRANGASPGRRRQWRVDHPYRHGIALLWRACRRAHETRPDPP